MAPKRKSREQCLPLLSEDEIHVWTVQLDRDCITERDVLSVDENERADRFHFEDDRNKYITCRSILRQKLGEYLKTAPDTLQFRYGSFGKPELADGPKIHFNVSHSGDVALIAFARCAEVGVDVERIRPMNDLNEMVNQVFSSAEQQQLSELPPGLMVESFYSGWTRKEAVVKALGDGLQIPLKSFDVCLNPNFPARLLRSDLPRLNPASCQLYSLDVGSEYAACAAVLDKLSGARLQQIAYA